MKLLFVYFNRYMRPRTQLSLSILDTIVIGEGHTTKIFDTSFYRDVVDKSEISMVSSGIHKKGRVSIKVKQTDPIEDFDRCIKEFKPDLIAFSFYSIDMDLHNRFLPVAKRNGVKVVCGGPTASIDPMQCFNNTNIDMVCFGEGEWVLKELCNRVDHKQDYTDIKGLWVRLADGIKNNGLAPLTDVSTLPIQNWDSYDKTHIYGLFEGNAYRMGHVETMRGCPFNCSYCGSGSIKKSYADCGVKYIRFKSPEKIVEECVALKDKYNLEIFYFTVGTFTAMPVPMLRKLSKLYGEKVGVPFIALVHPMTINSEVAKLLGEMGCIHASIGVESGVESFRKTVLNRNMSNEKIISSVRLLKANGIHVSAYNLTGIPGMDRAHMFKTIKLNKIAKPHSALISILIPFRDADLTKKLIADGLINEDEISIGTGLYPTVKISDMSCEEINGIFNTFNLYVKLPEILYPLIRVLEKDNKLTAFIRKCLYKIIEIERTVHLFFLRRKIKTRET